MAPVPSALSACRSLVLFALVAATALAGCVSNPAGGDVSERTTHDEIARLTHVEAAAAPDFSVETIDGEIVTLSELDGQVVLLEFMGAGCTSCRANLPHHFELYETFEGQDFAFVALDIWRSEDESDLREYRDRHDIPWPMAIAPAGIESTYGARGTPTHVFVDRDGNLHSRGGYVEAADLIAEVEYLLGNVTK